MGKYLHLQAVLNPNNAMHRELYDWVIEQSGKNTSDFVRSVLLLYKHSKEANQVPFAAPNTLTPVMDPYLISNDDSDAMADLL